MMQKKLCCNCNSAKYFVMADLDLRSSSTAHVLLAQEYLKPTQTGFQVSSTHNFGEGCLLKTPGHCSWTQGHRVVSHTMGNNVLQVGSDTRIPLGDRGGHGGCRGSFATILDWQAPTMSAFYTR
eukprot:1147367-Pelagomonas_calceolata.AAC.13